MNASDDVSVWLCVWLGCFSSVRIGACEGKSEYWYFITIGSVALLSALFYYFYYYHHYYRHQCYCRFAISTILKLKANYFCGSFNHLSMNLFLFILFLLIILYTYAYIWIYIHTHEYISRYIYLPICLYTGPDIEGASEATVPYPLSFCKRNPQATDNNNNHKIGVIIISNPSVRWVGGTRRY